MNVDNHAVAIGRLVANLQSLEVALRAFLLKDNEATEPPISLEHLSVGDTVAENSFTDWAALAELVSRFNQAVKGRCSEKVVDAEAVRIRDMMAHGRVMARTRHSPFHLVKFGRPRNGIVPVEDAVDLDAAWFSAKTALVREEILKVVEGSRALGQGIM